MVDEHLTASDAQQERPILNGTRNVQSRRVVLYSHDTMGVGHARRNVLIAQALARNLAPTTVLMIAGAPEMARFPRPAGVDLLTLPALRKEMDGSYRPRQLHVTLSNLIAVRAGALRAAVAAFQPDVLLVDKEPRGALGELGPTLELLRGRGACCILGLRDVLDDPETVRREWAAAANEDAIRTYYDAVWVYGDPAVYDPVREYGFAEDVAAKVRYTGYLNQELRLEQTSLEGAGMVAEALQRSGKLALCVVGGGQDGDHLAETFAHTDLPADMHGVIITGPFMPAGARRRLHRRATANPRLRILEFVPEADLLLSRADRVVTMGGYNSVCAVLSFDTPALVVPRLRPRREQAIRAERLRDLGLLDVLLPDRLTPMALREWLARDPRPRPCARDRIDLTGTECLPRLLAEALTPTR